MTGSAVVPGLRYRDAAAAIAFLCAAFGFERQLVVPGEGGTILHAQLTLGGGMVMLGSGRGEPGRPLADATAAGIYVVVPDADAACERARVAGARITTEPKDQEYGGRGFSCQDPEGFAWSCGSYDPWTAG